MDPVLPPSRPQAARFKESDRVTVLPLNPAGNPRTPPYLRGRSGMVVRCHGIIDNPLDHNGAYPPLYSIVFRLPAHGAQRDEVLADIHEEWLVAAP
jgi:hypothetical protein